MQCSLCVLTPDLTDKNNVAIPNVAKVLIRGEHQDIPPPSLASIVFEGPASLV
jgi:hypothetical protein